MIYNKLKNLTGGESDGILIFVFWEKMSIRKIFTFTNDMAGKKLVGTLLTVSLLSALINLSQIIVPTLLELFVNQIQSGVLDLYYPKILLILYGSVFLLHVLSSFVYGRIQIKAKARMTVTLADTILRMNPLVIKTKGEGFFSKLLEHTVDAVIDIFSPVNVSQFFYVVENFIILGILFTKNIVIGIICSVLFILYFAAYLVNNSVFSNLLMKYIEKNSESAAIIYDFIKGNRSLVSSERAITFAEKQMANIIMMTKKIEFKLQFLFDLLFLTLGKFIQPCANLVIICLVGYDVVNGDATFGSLVAIISYYNMMQVGCNAFQDISTNLFFAQGAVNSVQEFLSDPDSRARKPINLENKPDEESFFFKADKVSLKEGSTDILKDVSFTLSNEHHYCLTGISGSGKSCLTDILLGFLAPAEGKACFMNEENDVLKIWVFENLACYSQSVEIFNLPLEDNIFLGDEFSSDEYKDLVSVLHLEKLEGRLLGSNGQKISGGEKQRVALARFLHQLKSKQYYIIDEAFTALDGITKEEMLLLTKGALQGKTGICITHDDVVASALCDSMLVYKAGGNLVEMEYNTSKKLKDYISE